MEDKKEYMLEKNEQELLNKNDEDFGITEEEIEQLSSEEYRLLDTIHIPNDGEDNNTEEIFDMNEFAEFIGEDIPSAVEGINEVEEKNDEAENELDNEEMKEELENEMQNVENLLEEKEEKHKNCEENNQEKPKPKMKIKEVKYGMTVITNIGNFENIRTHIEATAEVDQDADFIHCIEELSNQIRRIGRNEYLQIKRKNLQKQYKERQIVQNQNNHFVQQNNQGSRNNMNGESSYPNRYTNSYQGNYPKRTQ